MYIICFELINNFSQYSAYCVPVWPKCFDIDLVYNTYSSINNIIKNRYDNFCTAFYKYSQQSIIMVGAQSLNE